ncbi:MAG: peptidase [Candidatus Aminicenantes bacterium]|nr:peptidase [Candidatus Aminicenantes bacterium]
MRNRRPVMARTALTCLWMALALAAQNPYAPDKPEPGSVEAIAKFVTEARFSNPWVSYVPDSKTVVSPSKYLKRIVGAAGELSSVSEIYGYFRELARTSPRVQVETIGRSDEGRDILLIIVSDEAAIQALDRLTSASAALADPRRTSPEQTEALIATAKPFYFLNAGLHSSETGSPETVMELAYRLAVSEQPMIRAIRREVVVLINPVSEPDGRDRFVEWFYRHLKGKTDYDHLPPIQPPYWGQYVFHDNNRDTHQAALETTRAVRRAFFKYHPVVVHDLHESIALLLTWNGTGPFNPNLDPIVISELFDMAFTEVRTLTGMGMPGVWTWAFGEGFGHHYLESIATNHNAIGRGYETFGNATAETVERDVRLSRFLNRPVTSREWYRPLPPPKRFRWSFRDNVNYMQTGILAALDYAALHSRDLLRNFYRKGYTSWQKGLKEKPKAFVIPTEQGDRRRVAQMINLLLGQRIEVGRAGRAFSVKEGGFPAGTFVVRLDQPYRNYALDLLAPQTFPKDADFQPYDDISWALPVHFGLEAVAVADEGIMKVPVEPCEDEATVRGKVSGKGPVFLLKDTGQEALLAARVRLGDFKIEIAEKTFQVGNEGYPPGSWLMPPQDGLASQLESVAAELGLDFTSAQVLPDGARHESRFPRIALWHPWADTQMIGWVRLVFDRQGIPYAILRDDDIKAGRLADRFDVIIHGDTGEDLKGQIHGLDTRFSPLAYTKTAEFPNNGFPVASDDITGGVGWMGMANLQRFVDGGGTLITLGNGSALALDGGITPRVGRARGENTVWTPGVEVVASFLRADHPLMYGYSVKTSVFRGACPVYNVRRADRGLIVLQWGSRPPKEDRDDEEETEASGKGEATKTQAMLVSGGLKGEDVLEGRPAILDIPVGKGRTIAYNFNPIHRELNHSDYRLLWNAILNWEAIRARLAKN